MLVAAVVATVVVLVLGGGDQQQPAAPQPIARSELMRQYAEINPVDSSATPETVDGLAESICTKLSEGHSTDKLITVATETYSSKATEVIRLLVSYRCPGHLKDFK
ncbi:hypothetical protein [Kibdelosporangium phytohabitans]|nr:hypothetical protein [Kibdelosporangium phytohabitans]MBE1465504.1 hypothetical protein [Kibdelosporangium phytohabitans]